MGKSCERTAWRLWRNGEVGRVLPVSTVFRYLIVCWHLRRSHWFRASIQWNMASACRTFIHGTFWDLTFWHEKRFFLDTQTCWKWVVRYFRRFLQVLLSSFSTVFLSLAFCLVRAFFLVITDREPRTEHLVEQSKMSEDYQRFQRRSINIK